MIASINRTVVPLIVAWIVGLLVSLGIDVSDAQRSWISSAIGAIIAALYYAAVRWAERKWPKLSILLGSTKQPTYTDTKPAP